MNLPSFWKGKIQEIDEAVSSVKRGNVKIIARSPGDKPVYLISYGKKENFKSQANYNSACGAGNPAFYAHKTASAKPVIFFVGPVHGQEMEGMVGLVNLINILETGCDLRGKEWQEIFENASKCRLLIIPCGNPDGRSRCPLDSFVGIGAKNMAHYGQGSTKDGVDYGWPGTKSRHPMVDDVGFLGAYFNDDGINIMHDDFFNPMARETKALLDTARKEAPNFIPVLHSHGSSPAVLQAAYVPFYIKEKIVKFSRQLAECYRRSGLPNNPLSDPSNDGSKYPPSAFNLTSALHHVCGGMSFTFECSHGLAEEIYAQVNHEQILDIQLLLYNELLKFALANPTCWEF
ncbi:hypothetical protein GF312_18665 [Candidatus Poribacteria bacterium]|nr:hypothetical protein [Candidatus Poribacteria bacterium]